jgi:hypothetical protein
MLDVHVEYGPYDEQAQKLYPDEHAAQEVWHAVFKSMHIQSRAPFDMAWRIKSTSIGGKEHIRRLEFRLYTFIDGNAHAAARILRQYHVEYYRDLTDNYLVAAPH